MFQDLDKFSLPDLEEKVLEFWKKNQIFEKAEKKNEEKEEYVFYEGPPTANGRPGIHHVLSRSFKDIVLRFQTMLGKNVRRRGGWDTHGLPVELEIEKELGLNSKPEIEEYGVGEFNRKCKESVWEYKDEWERLTERMGFWIDMEHPYITYENSYIETLWWIISKIDREGYLYKSNKVVPWCPRCGTALSSHELAQGYDEVTESSVFMKFRLEDGQEVGGVSTDNQIYILSWTTTPWTLPGNVALAVGENINYVLVESGEEHYILAKTQLEEVLGDEEYDVVSDVLADDLVGLSYEPLFNVDALREESSYKIYEADFVTTEEGTGVVHTAVMYGEDDYKLGEEVGLVQHHTVDEDGKFTSDVPLLEGDFVKANRVEDKVFNHLKENNNLLKTKEYTHEYPFCWRCDTPVLYYARDSWFIEMSKLRDDLLESNKDINWVPEHVKDGRFGEWLRGVKDWAISRERYWGTPLPIWECDSCETHEVLRGYEDLSDKLGGANNSYTVMRHGEAEHNTENIINSDPDNKDLISITDKGKEQAEAAAKKLKKKKIDLIFSSDFRRTKETAEIISKKLGVDVKYDKRLRETDTGDFDGESPKKYHDFFKNTQEKFSKTPPGGENLRKMTEKLWDFLKDVEENHKDKNVLMITHEYPVWMIETVMSGWGEEQSAREKDKRGDDFMGVGEFRDLELLSLPRNKWGIADPHRPYVDEVGFECEECGKDMKRVEEVMDVWFDSGAMPFAQAHYPFENKKNLPYPADYITEAVDQTRGWFYTLLAIGTLLGRDAPYRNVICLGLVLDKNGKKMSKSKGNTADPWEAAEKFGMDAIRWYFYTVNSPGESKRFDEEELKKVLRGFVLVLYNSFKFLSIYQDKNINLGNEDWKGSENVLDRWIISRINEVGVRSRENLEDYDIVSASRDIGSLVDDLSNWFIRRSRDRFRGDGSEAASSTLAYALLQVSKLSAPFIPFLSEALYQSLQDIVTGYDFEKSVHLEDWSEYGDVDEKLIERMKDVRKVASIALSQREEAGIKVRQPLSEVRVDSDKYDLDDKNLVEVLKDEINVKEVVLESGVEGGIELDTELTHKLKEEGWFRDLIRKIQSTRKSAGLDPGDPIILGLEGDDELEKIIKENNKKLMERVSAKKIKNKPLKDHEAEKETSIEDFKIKISLKKL